MEPKRELLLPPELGRFGDPRSQTIQVNETGTEAGAGAGIVAEVDSGVVPYKVVADRPFLYLLRDDLTGTILFLGQVTHPAE